MLKYSTPAIVKCCLSLERSSPLLLVIGKQLLSENVFKKVDYILTPSTPTTSFELGKKQDPLTMYLNDIFTVPASLAGLPGISLPVGLDKLGLPIGIQLIANAFDEPGLISTAHVLEKSANFNFIADGAAK